jgi:hypothetical protein
MSLLDGWSALAFLLYFAYSLGAFADFLSNLCGNVA